MLRRKIENQIREHFASGSDKVLLIDGARQVGKSYIVRHVGKELFENFIEVNMELDKVGDRLFAEARTCADFYMALSIVAGDRMVDRQSTLVFIDEIQAYDHLLTLLKFLREEGRFSYIASGSMLGVALRLTSSVPLGSIVVKQMFPLDFEEFLWANGVAESVGLTIRECYAAVEPLPRALHNKMIDLFRKYLIVGGLPDAVNCFVQSQNIATMRDIQLNIHWLYGIDASRYEQSHSRLKIQRIYSMIPSVMENRKKRIVATDIEQSVGKRMANYADEFDYLISAGIANEVRAVSKPVFPLCETMGKNLIKLYMNDVGLLTAILYRNGIQPILSDQRSINLGAVYESVVAQELRAHGHRLFYYDNKKNGEVDFLLDDYDHAAILPIEVKSGRDYRIHSSLNHFLQTPDYRVSRALVFSNDASVGIENGITYLPVYFVMCV